MIHQSILFGHIAVQQIIYIYPNTKDIMRHDAKWLNKTKINHTGHRRDCISHINNAFKNACHLKVIVVFP